MYVFWLDDPDSYYMSGVPRTQFKFLTWYSSAHWEPGPKINEHRSVRLSWISQSWGLLTSLLLILDYKMSKISFSEALRKWVFKNPDYLHAYLSSTSNRILHWATAWEVHLHLSIRTRQEYSATFGRTKQYRGSQCTLFVGNWMDIPV